MEADFSLLERYRRDRRNLLELLLSSGLIKEIRTPSGSTTSIANINLDVLSVDYVLECVESGGVLDISGATKKYYHESEYPVTMQSQLGESFFLMSDPESSGSPPRREPPSIEHIANNHEPFPANLPNHLVGRSATMDKSTTTASTSSKPMKNINIPSLGLPTLSTGLSDDDLRESAYEILLACIIFFGVQVCSFEDRKKEKSPRFLAGLKNKRDKRHVQFQSPEGQAEIFDTVRIQMQISEALDARFRQKLIQFSSRKPCAQMDVPQIALAFLNGLLKSDFVNERSYKQWKKRQANVLEELLSSADHVMTGDQSIRLLLSKIRDAEEWEMMSYHERAEITLAIRQIDSGFLSVPGRFGITGEIYYWSSGYHLNIRLYEKLLFGLFDILEEGQLIEEADEFLKHIKLTWSLLGITEMLHDALYGWVLFQQFVGTRGASLLDHAVLQVKKVMSAEDSDKKEYQYINCLMCSTASNGCEKKLSLVQAIFSSIRIWCDSNLWDYHLHFAQNPSFFQRVMTMSLNVGTCDFGECGEVKSQLAASDALSEICAQEVRTYVQMSIEAAYRRVTETIDVGSTREKSHSLLLLANELLVIAERELKIFLPVLRYWCPGAGRVSAMLLHKLYGERLKPFLMEVSCLSEDVRMVLPAAYNLENNLIQLYTSAFEENGYHSHFFQDFEHYQIGEVSKPTILDWLITQHELILEWTGRTFDLEDWEPLSNQQKQAVSAVEVFRIIEETVDQLFGLNLPVDVVHLQALLSTIIHALDTYLQKLVSQLVGKQHLYPTAPSLTRYKDTAFPIVKKKLVECLTMEEDVHNKLNKLTVSKLCVRLNTLLYIQRQLSALEDGIRRSWTSMRVSENRRCSEENSVESETLDELLAATFDSTRDTAADAIRKICMFTGAKVVFWDLRDTFLFRLYHGSVEGARLDSLLPQFDGVLNRVCSMIDDTIRDLLVSSICKASLEGYVWVLLDGGPSRAFSDSDISMMEDDLSMLKDFFIADGEGLPRSLVEAEAKFAHQILSLFALQTESVIQMLISASERIPTVDSRDYNSKSSGDAHTLIRVLCHKKDREASNFLKGQYHLPASSGYDDTPSEIASSKSPLVAELLKRSSSFRWPEKGNNSFSSIKKKLQEATSDIRYAPW